MSFTVILLPAHVEEPRPAYAAALKIALTATGGSMDSEGRVSVPDGGAFVFEGGDFQLNSITPKACNIIFEVARQTNTYVTNGGGAADLVPLTIKGSTVTVPPELGTADVVATPDILCSKLRIRLAHWTTMERRLRAERVIGPDGQPLQPSPSPGTELRLTSDPSGMAAECEEQSRQMASQLGWRFVRSVITRSEAWGVVWRADVAPEPDPATWFRESCWGTRRVGSGGKIIFSSRPLKMFDGFQSISPLSPDY